VAAGLADRCEVQVAYAIGVAHPVSVMVETFGTEMIARTEIAGLIDVVTPAERSAAYAENDAEVLEHLRALGYVE